MAVAFVGHGPISAATTSPLTVTLPTHSVGDFLMMCVFNRTAIAADNDTQFVVPAGWELLTSSEGLNEPQYIYGKIAEPGETNPGISCGDNVSIGWGAFIAAFSGVHATDFLDTGLRWNAANSTTALEVTPLATRTQTDGAYAVVVVIAEVAADNPALKAGFEEGYTPIVDIEGTIGDTWSWFLAGRAVASAGPINSPTIESTSPADLWQCVGTLSLRPAAVAPVGPRLVVSQKMWDQSGAAPDYTITYNFDFEPKVGDLILVAAASKHGGTPPVIAFPMDYTELVNLGGSNFGSRVFYKISDGTETQVVATNSQGNWGWMLAAQLWRGVDTSTPFDVTTTTNTTASNVAATMPSITPVTDDCAVVSIGFTNNDYQTPVLSAAQSFQPSWFDRLLWGSGTGFDNGFIAADRFVASAGAVTGPTFTVDAAVVWNGVTMALRPSAAAPDAPTNPAATTNSQTQITVTWDDVADETGYRVERSPDGTGSWVDVSGNLPAGTVTWPDTGLTCNTQYFYRVVAFNSDGDSPPSTVVDATTDACAPPTPSGNRMGDGAIRRRGGQPR